MFELLSSDDRDPDVRLDGRPVTELGDSGVEVELLTKFSNWQPMPFHRTFAAGEKYEAVRSSHAREEWTYVRPGEMEVYLCNQNPHILVPGDLVHFARSRLDALDSMGNEPLQFI